MNSNRATMEAEPIPHSAHSGTYNQDDATGFIRLNGLRLKVAAKVHGKKKMSAWNKILASVAAKTREDNTFFRGQPNASWPLLPGLGRLGIANPKNKELILYYDFHNYSGPLMPENRNSWRTIFLMQHHGLPTRLLDWTGSFGVALYFALKGAKGNAAVWILDPFELNKHTVNNQALLSPSDLASDYEQLFISEDAKLDGSVVALV